MTSMGPPPLPLYMAESLSSIIHLIYVVCCRSNLSLLCGRLLWRFANQQQTAAPQSGHALLTQVGSMCS